MKTPLLTISLALCALALPSALFAETVTAEPDAFLEYVEADGNQYIDTGVNAETGLKARLDFEWSAKVASNGNDDWSLLDAATTATASDNRSRVFLCHLYNQKPFFGYGLKERGNPSGTTEYARERRYEILTDISDTNSLELAQNGKKTFSAGDRSKYAANGNVDLHLNLFVFACNYSGTPNWYGRGKLYELKIFRKNATTGEFDLLRHYLPCIKDGRPGLYDKANGTISYSFTSSNLVAGAVLDKPLDFVKSIQTIKSVVSGKGGQYFDTWVWGKSGLKSQVDVSVREYDGDHCILGCNGTANNGRVYMAYHYEKAFRFAHGTLPGTTDINVVAPTNDVLTATHNDVRYRIKADMTAGAQSMTVSRNGGEPVQLFKDGFDYGSTFSNYLAAGKTLYLLANHRYDDVPTCPSSCVLYGAKIWDGDELLRDFVPVVATNSSGVAYAGLYDKVAERIHKPRLANDTTATDYPLDLDTAQVGAVTNTLRAVDGPTTRLEYVDSDYNYDYVDLGVMANAGLEMEATLDWLSVPGERAFVGARGASGNSTPRIYLYSAYNNNSTIPSQHAFHYNASAWTARNSSNTGIAMETNTTYKVRTRIDAGEQNITVWKRTDGGWEQLGTRNLDRADNIRLDIPLYMFNCNDNGIARYPVKARCRSVKLSVKQQDGSYALARDLVPVRDPVTGGGALWDKVSQTYFRNGGKYMLVGGGEERPLLPPFVLVVR